MFEIVLANILTGIGKTIDLFSVSCKTKNKLILIQIFSFLMYLLSTVLLKAYSASIQFVFGIIRNFLVYKDVKSKIIDVLLIVLPVGLGIAINNLGIIGLLPVFANLFYSYAVIKLKDRIAILKLAFVFQTFLYLIFCFAIKNYVGAAFNVVVVVYGFRLFLKAAGEEKAANCND